MVADPCHHPEAARRTRVETAYAVIDRCSVCERDVAFDYSRVAQGLDVERLREAARRVGLPREVTVGDLEDLAREYDALAAEERA